MDPSNAALASEQADEELIGPAALLRGTARGLEMFVNARAGTDAILAALDTRLGEAPAFFRNNDVRITVEDGPLPAGCLTRLDDLAVRFALRIVEVSAAAIPEPTELAAGSAPTSLDDEPIDDTLAELEAIEAESPESFEEPTQIVAMPMPPAPAPAPAPALPAIEGARLFVGPVRSGVILDHLGHIIIFGDVNPGAEVRATGNIVVLGRLRGTAHAGIGADGGFILALRLEAQQLRICKKVARPDSNTPSNDAEIAYVTGDQIVVERYTSRLPGNTSASI